MFSSETSVSSREVQTVPYTLKDMSCQGLEVSDQGSQTSFGIQDAEQLLLQKELFETAVTSRKLLAFLQRSFPILKEQIQESMSQDWEGIRSCMHPRSVTGTEFESIVQTHTIYGDHLIHFQEELQHREEGTTTGSKDQDLYEMTIQEKKKRAQSAMSIAGRSFASINFSDTAVINPLKRMVITALDWNSSSSLIMIGHGKEVRHEEWCNHESFLFVYSLYRDYCRDSGPSLHLDIDGCVTVIKSHPNLSSIFAIGCFSGRVVLADVSLKLLFEPSLQYHDDRVTRLHWTSESGFNLLISLGIDGRILLWRLQIQNTVLQGNQQKSPYDLSLLQVFSVFIHDLPKGLAGSYPREKSSSRRNTNDIREVPSEVGISCSALSPSDPNMFVIGCIGGAVFLCSFSLEASSSITGSQDRRSLLSGKSRMKASSSHIKISFTPHRSNVQALDFNCHNFHGDPGRIFLSCDQEGEVRVYNLIDSRPISIIHLEGVGHAIRICFWSHINRGFIFCLKENSTICAVKFFEESDNERDGSSLSKASDRRLKQSNISFLASMMPPPRNMFLNKKNISSNLESIAVVASNGDVNLYEVSC